MFLYENIKNDVLLGVWCEFSFHGSAYRLRICDPRQSWHDNIHDQWHAKREADQRPNDTAYAKMIVQVHDFSPTASATLIRMRTGAQS